MNDYFVCESLTKIWSIGAIGKADIWEILKIFEEKFLKCFQKYVCLWYQCSDKQVQILFL